MVIQQIDKEKKKNKYYVRLCLSLPEEIEIMANGYGYRKDIPNEMVNLSFWVGRSWDDGEEIATFNQWVYVKKATD